ncbi:response regulator [Sphingomonas koreensis]|uniref:response regulator n=1 Tax=Sphingomonas koreensis TaxID=93064 RepID=UPI000834A12F|nr:response regulator [Sphingomonas koreensis]RSU56260.1 response regulator [Sphingomonas koreensis]RSU64762.1 response regulator [Sphingomonas koreensis]
MINSRILIVDDSATIRAMVEELLANQGNCPEIAMAPDVPEARRLVEVFRPTIITLDLNMPGIDGFAFLDELATYPHAPVVVVSSASTIGSAAAQRALDRGAAACFDKAKILSESKAFIRTLKKASVRKMRTISSMPTAYVQTGSY